MTAVEATEVVFRAWENADAGAVAALFAPDGRYEDPLLPEPLVGRDAIRAGVQGGMDEIRDLRIPVRLIVVDGDTAVSEASFLSELASGDGRLDFDFAMVVEMRDGQIARLTEYFDASPFRQ